MISILLTVLKIIGIAVLMILGLLLLILLFALFVPVRYRGNGSYQDGVFTARLRASWLLRAVSAMGAYQNRQSLHIYLKICGITVYDNQKITGKKKRHKKRKSTKTKTKDRREVQAASSEDALSEDDFPENDFQEEMLSQETIPEEEEAGMKQSENTVDGDPQDELTDNGAKKIGILRKIKNFLINFVNFFKNIKFTFHKVCDTIVKIKENIKYYIKILQLDSTKRAFATCQKQLGYVLKKLSPRKYRINLHLGFDDPAVMGEALAVWGMFYPLHQGNIDIQPEFGQSVAEGDFSFQGRISVFVFVHAAWILYFDKDIKRLVKRLKRGV